MTENRVLNVLIVEEDARTRDLLRVGLDSFSSFNVESIEPEWAAEITRDRAFDLILVNLEMSDGSDGLEVVQAIRENNPRPEFILLTRGRSSRFLSSQKNANNIFAFLTLPLDVSAFFKTIARARDRIIDTVPAAR
jgi:DNA-binding NtrC family response regulator